MLLMYSRHLLLDSLLLEDISLSFKWRAAHEPWVDALVELPENMMGVHPPDCAEELGEDESDTEIDPTLLFPPSLDQINSVFDLPPPLTGPATAAPRGERVLGLLRGDVEEVLRRREALTLHHALLAVVLLRLACIDAAREPCILVSLVDAVRVVHLAKAVAALLLLLCDLRVDRVARFVRHARAACFERPSAVRGQALSEATRTRGGEREIGLRLIAPRTSTPS